MPRRLLLRTKLLPLLDDLFARPPDPYDDAPMSQPLLDAKSATRVNFGIDHIDHIGAAATDLGAKRVLIASDPGIIAVGHTQRAVDALQAANLTVEVFEGVHENPTTEDVDRGLALAQQFQPDLIVGLGGGSSMDCAKGINFLFSCGGQMQDYWGVGKATGPLLPMIAIPTTAGTGSETQSFALISDAKTHLKMACGDKRAAFRMAILDPRLTLTQPPKVTALTGIDAISHAIETYVTKKRNPKSQSLSREAWRLLSLNFPRVLDQPNDITARGGMQLGACFAGLAIENSMLGAAHALANPLTAEFGIIHGQAVAIVLPHVIRFNQPVVADAYEQLEAITPSDQRTTGDLAVQVTQLIKQAGLNTTLSACNIDRDHLPRLANAAAKQWTGTFNPRDVDAESLLQLYEAAFDEEVE